jgi:hypothetical protein
MVHDEFTDLVIWIRNCIHLLTADSAGIEKIQQYRLFLCSGGLLAINHLGVPSYGSHLVTSIR